MGVTEETWVRLVTASNFKFEMHHWHVSTMLSLVIPPPVTRDTVRPLQGQRLANKFIVYVFAVELGAVCQVN